MNLTSIFEPDGPIPTRHTCDGQDESPALSWSDAPEDVKGFVLIVDDPDAPVGTFVHWVLYDIPAQARGLPKAIPPRESVAGVGTQGLNDFGRIGYGGPCPPAGRPHRYVFTLSALDARLGLAPRTRAADVRRAMRSHVLAEAELVGRFGRTRRVSAAGSRPRRDRR